LLTDQRSDVTVGHITSLPPPLSERDAAVVRLVGRFRQLTSRHVRCVLFADVTEMPVNRSLRRLVAMGYLTRLPRVFGDGRGSHGWIYQLRRKGWIFAERAGTFKKAYKPNWHALMVADVYCDLLEASRAGRYELLGFELEVERTPAKEPIRPDAMLHIKGQTSTVTLLLEAETGSHGLKGIDNKCGAYWQASRAQPGDFKAVIFAVPDGEHMRRVRNATNAGPSGSAALFDVCLSTDVAQIVEKYLD
jgi:Replication-relaxation